MPIRRNASKRKATPAKKAGNAKPKTVFSKSKKPYHPKFPKRGSVDWVRKKPSTGRPDIRVKKTNYSKTVRNTLLASADARQKLIEMGGENTINIIREFDRDMSDEELARKTGIKASDVRVVLNRLHSHGFFSYTRVRDKDSGWYSYIWRMSEPKLNVFVENYVAHDEVGERVVEFVGDAYHCVDCSPGSLVGFETAAETKFKCMSCGSLLQFFEKK